MRSISARIRLFISPDDYVEAIKEVERSRGLQHRVQRQQQEIEQLREELDRQVPGVIVTGKDGSSHHFDQATHWEVGKDGVLRIYREFDKPDARTLELAAFAPGSWRDARRAD